MIVGEISGRGFLGLPQKELVRQELSVPSADISSRCAWKLYAKEVVRTDEVGG